MPFIWPAIVVPICCRRRQFCSWEAVGNPVRYLYLCSCRNRWLLNEKSFSKLLFLFVMLMLYQVRPPIPLCTQWEAHCRSMYFLCSNSIPKVHKPLFSRYDLSLWSAQFPTRPQVKPLSFSRGRSSVRSSYITVPDSLPQLLTSHSCCVIGTSTDEPHPRLQQLPLRLQPPPSPSLEIHPLCSVI